jgi:hypothetical protein
MDAVEEKILAIEFLLSTFNDNDENNRKELINQTISKGCSNDVQDYLQTYSRFPKKDLQEFEKQLREEKRILLKLGESIMLNFLCD